ncbi:NAD(P)-binding protein [Armillaria gallica]|uniref:NAD(P)-binding protein n=1 Tax=Armillaria gallica TaxID=47427 RepID=A0A2H3CHJ9_ARMGA|nr:NAD(P)-binding protein [Armillaria gallica]
MANKPVAVIAGLSSGSGTGAAAAHLLTKEGYAITLVARGADSLKALVDEINAAGGTATPFPISSYNTTDINAAYAQIRAHYQGQPICVALYNATHPVWKPFLDITPEDIQAVTQTLKAREERVADLHGSHGECSREHHKRLSAGKHALRALSPSLAKKFGKQNIHVSHAIIDGGILTNASRERRNDPEWEQNEDVRLSPDGIETYLYFIKQSRSSWTWELDLRPAHEKW